MTKLDQAFADLDENKKQLADDTLAEYVFFLAKIDELKKLPLIVADSRMPEIQKTTPAGKLIKEYSQIVDAKRATLIRLLEKNAGDGADDLLAQMLREG